MRIKLPGSPKVKAIILAVLVVISLVIIGRTAVYNRKNTLDTEEKLEKTEEKIQQVSNENDENIIKDQDTNTEKLKDTNDDDDNHDNTDSINKSDDSIEDSKQKELYQKAYDQFHNKQYKEAIDTANSLVAQYPNSYEGYSIKGIAEGFNGNFEQGMKDIDKALEINSNYGYGRFNKALLYELNGRFDEALDWYNKALEVEKYMWSYYGKASIYGRRGAIDEAVANINLAITVAPSEEDKKAIKEAAKTESDFDPISGDKKFQDAIN